jgi:hypothetical protein
MSWRGVAERSETGQNKKMTREISAAMICTVQYRVPQRRMSEYQTQHR